MFAVDSVRRTKRPRLLISAITMIFAGTVLTVPAFAATPDASSSKTIIGVGDSFTSGVGASTLDAKSGICRRSADSYPLLAAKELGMKGANAACSGAPVSALTETFRGQLPQLGKVGDADYVVMTIGGNDVLSLSSAANLAFDEEEFATEIKELTPKLTSALQSYKGSGKLMVLAYPNLFPTSTGSSNATAGTEMKDTSETSSTDTEGVMGPGTLAGTDADPSAATGTTTGTDNGTVSTTGAETGTVATGTGTDTGAVATAGTETGTVATAGTGTETMPSTETGPLASTTPDSTTAVPSTGTTSNACTTLVKTATPLLTQAYTQLNAAVEQATKDAGAIYVDTSKAFEGHDVCSAEPWVTGLDQPDVALHPNDLGHAALAKATVTAIESSPTPASTKTPSESKSTTTTTAPMAKDSETPAVEIKPVEKAETPGSTTTTSTTTSTTIPDGAVASPETGKTLAMTGADTPMSLAIGASLIAMGLGLVWLRMRLEERSSYI